MEDDRDGTTGRYKLREKNSLPGHLHEQGGVIAAARGLVASVLIWAGAVLVPTDGEVVSVQLYVLEDGDD